MKRYFSYNSCFLLYFSLSVSLLLGCSENHDKPTEPNANEAAILEIHQDYLQGWRNMDEAKIMGLLEDDSRIQPNRISPIEGIDNIRRFWFPNDSSRTVINKYLTKLLNLSILDTLAVTTHSSELDWSYSKDTINFSMLQHGINTTVYKLQEDGNWKIWHSMWTDIKATRK